MERAPRFSILCLVAVLLGAASALAQPKLIVTGLGSDLSNDGNTVLGGILDPNVYTQLMTFTRGAGFQARGPIGRGVDGALRMTDITGGQFFMAASLPNGFYGSTFWPTNNPTAFGTYTGSRPCCNGSTCTVIDPRQCLAPAYALTNGSTCSPSPCLATPPSFGGCCDAVSGVCTYVSASACTGQNYFYGDNLACGNYPCVRGHTMPFRFSSTTNSWTNVGSFPLNTGGAGQGAAKCDGTVATNYGISADGRYLVGGGDYGTFAATSCTVRGYVYDNTNNSFQMLPLIGTAAGCQNFSQAWAVGTNGAVLGRDMHAATDPAGNLITCNGPSVTVWEPDANGQYFVGRTARACCDGSTCTLVDPMTCPAGSVALAAVSCTPQPCPAGTPASGACCDSRSLNCAVATQAQCAALGVWIGNGSCSPRNPCLPATETVLDPWGAGGLLGAAMTRDGTRIAATISYGKASYVLADSSAEGDLCTYTKNAGSGAWDFVRIGKVAGSTVVNSANMQPRAITSDGNTIIGSYSGGSFIWRPTLNGGVPMDFNEYVRSLNGGQPYPPTGSISLGGAISADGNAVLVSYSPPGPEACAPGTGLTDLGRAGILYFNGASIPCQPPVIAGGPYDVFEREYTRFGMVGNVFFAASYPFTLQWQRESPTGSNNWINLTDSCGTFTSDNSWTYEGTQGMQLRVNELADASVRDGRYRVVVSDSCGSATSAVANISAVSGACCYYDTTTFTTACAVVIGTRCTQAVPFGLNGVYAGDGTTCTPTVCDAYLGACCSYNGVAQCSIDVSSHCTTALASGGNGGTFAGGGTTCTPAVCDSVSGACCYSPDGFTSVTCSFELASRCTQAASIGGLAGVYSGNGIACAAGPSCPAGTVGIGACCFNMTLTTDIACSVQSSTHCTATFTNHGLQGKYLGDGVACGASTCKPALFGQGSDLGACCFTDPNNPASGALCLIMYRYNCQNYPNGSNDANAAPFNQGTGGNFYPNTCCMPSTTPPISGCSTSVNCDATAGACVSTPFDLSTGPVCTVQVRATRCTRRYNQGGLFGTFVAGTPCSPSVVSASTGSCCYQPTDGTGAPSGCAVCVVMTQDRCTTVNNGGLGGMYGGNGSACSPSGQCPAAQYGVCCTGTTCAVTARSACTGSGSYALPSQTCANSFCQVISVQPPPSGACCNTTSLACSVSVQSLCSGTWIYNATCDSSLPCAQPASGACCTFGNACMVDCVVDCVSVQGGEYRGDGTTCSPNPCGVQQGVCCRGATCAITAAIGCSTTLIPGQTAGATFSNTQNACNSTVISSSPCCHANYNKINGITVQDIFDFLSDWFAGSPYANTGHDGAPGPLSVQNIFDFLSNWFAGGC